MSRHDGNGYVFLPCSRIQVGSVAVLGSSVRQAGFSNQATPHPGLCESMLPLVIGRPKMAISSALSLPLPAGWWGGRARADHTGMCHVEIGRSSAGRRWERLAHGRSGPVGYSQVGADPWIQAHQRRADGVTIGGTQPVRSGRRTCRFDRPGSGGSTIATLSTVR